VQSRKKRGNRAVRLENKGSYAIYPNIKMTVVFRQKRKMAVVFPEKNSNIFRCTKNMK
jgi:hypothetical protein